MNLRKITLIVLTLAFICGLAIYKVYTKPHKEVTDAHADFTLSSSNLYLAYSENEDEANAKYLNKIIEVEGKISTTNSLEGGASIALDCGDPMGGITCEFESPESLKGMSVGQSVKIKGFCTGKLIDVVLVRCSVQKI
ncbi:MAG: hypothetical protein R2774_08890 [Saprospiraceae bacterium]